MPWATPYEGAVGGAAPGMFCVANYFAVGHFGPGVMLVAIGFCLPGRGLVWQAHHSVADGCLQDDVP